MSWWAIDVRAERQHRYGRIRGARRGNKRAPALLRQAQVDDGGSRPLLHHGRAQIAGRTEGAWHHAHVPQRGLDFAAKQEVTASDDDGGARSHGQAYSVCSWM